MKFYTAILLVFVFTNGGYAQWTQAGADIDGEFELDEFGYSMDMNGDGSVVAIGSMLNDEFETYSGHVRVFSYADGVWSQKGSDIDGTSAYQKFGKQVSLSDNGNILAVSDMGFTNGAAESNVLVFKFVNDEWIQLGQTLYTGNPNDNFGESIDLNDAGDLLAIGIARNDSIDVDAGQVLVYKFIDNEWELYGNPLLGENADDWFGTSVRLNNQGNILAVGISKWDEIQSTANRGKVQVFEYIEGSWEQIGDDILGEGISEDQFGLSVRLNGDGTRLMVSKILNEWGYPQGIIRVFDYSNDSWEQVGSEISGENWSDLAAVGIDINDEGDILAIGGHRNSDAGNLAGNVRVFNFEGDDWQQLGIDIDGENADDRFGYRVCMNNTGYVFAASGRLNDGNGEDAGHARIYTYGPQGLGVEALSAIEYKVYPSPATDYVIIEGTEIENVSIIGMNGRIISRVNVGHNDFVQLDLNQYDSGIYLLNIEGKYGREVKRLVVN